ncbi:MAG TPA: hypothetical protein VGH54_21425 [Mycobacterium sp.]|jgi:hypothetical protein|uniref:hypothetical protein n=1 Tax=Mycobacterium sp. TaxID=1785 RepID=UPI002F41B3BF
MTTSAPVDMDLSALNATAHANYRGDRRQALGQVVGPTTYGHHMVVVDAAYDPATDRTRLGFVNVLKAIQDSATPKERP